MGYANNPRIVTDGLVFCSDAATPKSYPGSGNTLYDISGYGNDSTSLNAVSYTGESRGAITSFFGYNNGLTNLVSWPLVTISCWVKFVSGGSLEIRIYNISGTGKYSLFSPTVNTLNFISQGDSGSSSEALIEDASLVNTWCHVCGVSAGLSDLRLYINGELASQDTTTRAGTATFNTVYLNFLSSNLMGPSSVYNRALSSAEILQNYTALKSRFGHS